jgi:DNA-binding NarL/FixJ family response regulator
LGRRRKMKKKNKILIVDDEIDFARAVRKTLENRGCEVVTAGNRSEAEAVAKDYPLDLVILGTIMPRGDAFLFHKWLKQVSRFTNVPVMVINARREEEITRGWRREEGMECEAEAFLAKPVEPEKLVPIIEKLMDKATHRIKVLVADDHAMVRDGIRAVIDLQKDMQVVGEAVNGKEALDKTIELSPDVVVMDIVMPIMNGLDATRQIHRECPLARVLMLTQYDDEENVLASRQAGALGFVPKAAASSLLLDGIRSVNKGKQLTFASN